MQFIMCCAIFMTSLPVLFVQGFPPFHGFAMLGGALWCTGNMMCGPIINYIGMGMGILVWGSTNMLMGWASGTFGIYIHRLMVIITFIVRFIWPHERRYCHPRFKLLWCCYGSLRFGCISTG